jgi:hypothetical protein
MVDLDAVIEISKQISSTYSKGRVKLNTLFANLTNLRDESFSSCPISSLLSSKLIDLRFGVCNDEKWSNVGSLFDDRSIETTWTNKTKYGVY